jgi:tubulin-specific chaperone E
MTLITCFVALCSDEMSVFLASQKRVSVEFVGTDKVQEKLNNFNELTCASALYIGLSSIRALYDLRGGNEW